MSLLAAASRLLRLLAPRPRAANRAGAVNPHAPASSRVADLRLRRHPQGRTRVVMAASSPSSSSSLPPENDDASGEIDCAEFEQLLASDALAQDMTFEVFFAAMFQLVDLWTTDPPEP